MYSTVNKKNKVSNQPSQEISKTDSSKNAAAITHDMNDPCSDVMSTTHDERK